MESGTKPVVSGTIPTGRFWAGERTRMVKLAKPAQLQPICITELNFVPEISIRNLDKIAFV